MKVDQLLCKLFGHKQPLKEQQFATPELAFNGKIIKPHIIIPKFKNGHKFWVCDRCGKRVFL